MFITVPSTFLQFVQPSIITLLFLPRRSNIYLPQATSKILLCKLRLSRIKPSLQRILLFNAPLYLATTRTEDFFLHCSRNAVSKKDVVIQRNARSLNDIFQNYTGQDLDHVKHLATMQK